MRHLELRPLLLIGRLDEAERAVAELDPAPFPAAFRTAYEPVVAGIPALIAEVANASRVLDAPAARLIAGGEERLLLQDDVKALLASDALVVDSCRHFVRDAGTVVCLATRPVLFALAQALREEWPGDVTRGAGCPQLPGQARR